MDFWRISPYLPRDTREFVPRFIAVAYSMTYHCEHNICPVTAKFPVVTDTIMVERALHFDQIAEIMQFDKELIRFYNPHFKREIIPGNLQPTPLRLPIDKAFHFLAHADTIYAHRFEELLAHATPVDGNVQNSRRERITHIAKAGETLTSIASLYGVTAQNLRNWNGLSGTRVTPGRRVAVIIDNGGLTFAAQKASSAAAAAAYNPVVSSGEGYLNYQVQSGDTLSTIARRYPGATVRNIQELNGMTTTFLRIGQILKIPAS
jgi:membrane-bound lytic murein transglycosylase D